jgi:hypothetical protein
MSGFLIGLVIGFGIVTLFIYLAKNAGKLKK